MLWTPSSPSSCPVPVHCSRAEPSQGAPTAHMSNDTAASTWFPARGNIFHRAYWYVWFTKGFPGFSHVVRCSATVRPQHPFHLLFNSSPVSLHCGILFYPFCLPPPQCWTVQKEQELKHWHRLELSTVAFECANRMWNRACVSWGVQSQPLSCQGRSVHANCLMLLKKQHKYYWGSVWIPEPQRLHEAPIASFSHI